ncbi:hypothetical protein ACVWYG_001213 [Pedobacter sp. UYEF25]
MITNSRRKFLRNAGLGIAGLTILPKVNGAHASSIIDGEDTLLGEKLEPIDQTVEDFFAGKTSNPYSQRYEDFTQHAEVFEEANYLLQNEHIARSII